MHLMMSGKEKERFVLRSRLLYGKCTTRSQKPAIIDDLMQYIGYKSRKHAITVLAQSQNRQKRKKKGPEKFSIPNRWSCCVKYGQGWDILVLN